jgi:hypothetical protein
VSASVTTAGKYIRPRRPCGLFLLSLNRSVQMNIFYIIGVVVVVIFVAGFFGLHV